MVVQAVRYKPCAKLRGDVMKIGKVRVIYSKQHACATLVDLYQMVITEPLPWEGKALSGLRARALRTSRTALTISVMHTLHRYTPATKIGDVYVHTPPDTHKWACAVEAA
jgi:hypothetical protein